MVNMTTYYLYWIHKNKIMDSNKIITSKIDQFKKDIKKALNCFKALGGDEWARTTDSRIFSPMLYQLSYITVLE